MATLEFIAIDALGDGFSRPQPTCMLITSATRAATAHATGAPVCGQCGVEWTRCGRLRHAHAATRLARVARLQCVAISVVLNLDAVVDCRSRHGWREGHQYPLLRHTTCGCISGSRSYRPCSGRLASAELVPHEPLRARAARPQRPAALRDYAVKKRNEDRRRWRWDWPPLLARRRQRRSRSEPGARC